LMKPLAETFKGRLVVVSNRGPYTWRQTPQGLRPEPSVGGLVSSLEPIMNREGGTWIAWGGRHSSEDEAVGLSLPVPEQDPRYIFHEVLLTNQEASLYYEGFANSCLWPLCHSFVDKTVFHEKHWQAYRKANDKYARVLLKTTGPDEDLIWIHDYHLALLPACLRRYRPHARISLFWHIPSPPAEIFALMPWAKEVLRGMLHSELIGFHTRGYARNFLQAAAEITGAEVDFPSGRVSWSGRRSKVIEAPIGINWRDFNHLSVEDEDRKSVV
jgi:trehalose 6-phosphate synthase/phosphatase